MGELLYVCGDHSRYCAMYYGRRPLHVIASRSEAIQSAACREMDCFVACAPRNDGGKQQ